MIYQFIEGHAANHRVGLLCRALRVSRSGFYDWRRGDLSARREANQRLLADIAEIHRQSRQTYGSPRIWYALRQRGLRCGRKRVARLMRQHQIRAKTKRRFKITTRSRRGFVDVPDLVQRNFHAPAPNRVWTSDITYLWTREGWVYLAVILDLYSRMVVGWELSDRLTTDVVTSALMRALDRRRPSHELVLHSDRGSQYTSDELKMLAFHNDIRLSMGAKGSCYDNAASESFFHTLKTEHAYFERYESREKARHSIFDYIEVFYNRQRIHTTIGGLSPWQYEQLQETP